MTPLTQESRLFTIFFAIVGISVVALAVGEISGFIIEKETAKVEEFNRLLAQKLSQVRHLLAPPALLISFHFVSGARISH